MATDAIAFAKVNKPPPTKQPLLRYEQGCQKWPAASENRRLLG